MKKILVVDDSMTMRRMIISSLHEIPSLQFEQAGSGLEAIEKLSIFRFDLIILDLNMPDIHGMEVLKFMRSNIFYKNIPIVVLTTKSDEETRKEALESGADLFATKPYVPSVFAGNLKSLLNI